MAKINYRALELAIDKPLERAFRRRAMEISQEVFNEAKSELVDEYMEHPVTQEILMGKNDPGARGSLGTSGNLWGFIGFDEGSDPVGDLLEFLDENVKMNKTPTYHQSRKEYRFTVLIPAPDEIKKVTPMPWGTSRSWVYAIERGISGLNAFLGKPNISASRSGGGIQTKKPFRSGVRYKARKYLSQIINNFIEKIR